jgi:hypothetical protein
VFRGFARSTPAAAPGPDTALAPEDDDEPDEGDELVAESDEAESDEAKSDEAKSDEAKQRTAAPAGRTAPDYEARDFFDKRGE